MSARVTIGGVSMSLAGLVSELVHQDRRDATLVADGTWAYDNWLDTACYTGDENLARALKTIGRKAFARAWEAGLVETWW